MMFSQLLPLQVEGHGGAGGHVHPEQSQLGSASTIFSQVSSPWWPLKIWFVIPKVWMMSSQVRPLQVEGHGGGGEHAHPVQSHFVFWGPSIGNASWTDSHENDVNCTPLYTFPQGTKSPFLP